MSKFVLLAIFSCLLVVAFAQNTSSLAGIWKDATTNRYIYGCLNAGDELLYIGYTIPGSSDLLGGFGILSNDDPTHYEGTLYSIEGGASADFGLAFNGSAWLSSTPFVLPFNLLTKVSDTTVAAALCFAPDEAPEEHTMEGEWFSQDGSTIRNQCEDGSGFYANSATQIEADLRGNFVDDNDRVWFGIYETDFGMGASMAVMTDANTVYQYEHVWDVARNNGTAIRTFSYVLRTGDANPEDCACYVPPSPPSPPTPAPSPVPPPPAPGK